MVRDYEADYVSCVFDPKGKTFRDDVYPEYKATRSPMPDDLRLQIEPVFEAVDALGLNRLVVDNYEADDVIGTLAREGAERGWKVIISTGDKDMAQLVNEHVSLINTMKNERMGRDEVFAKFGVYPEQIIDYLTLVGDTVDNVPGVEKVGPKTAAKWLGEYGTLDNLLANAESIKGVVGENLRKAAVTEAAGSAIGEAAVAVGTGKCRTVDIDQANRTALPGLQGADQGLIKTRQQQTPVRQAG